MLKYIINDLKKAKNMEKSDKYILIATLVQLLIVIPLVQYINHF